MKRELMSETKIRRVKYLCHIKKTSNTFMKTLLDKIEERRVKGRRYRL